MFRYFEEKDRADYIRFSKVFHNSDAILFKVGEENFHKTFDMVLEKSPYAAAFMVENNGEAAGYALLTFSYSNEMGGVIAWIEEIYIDGKFRGHGLGGKCLDFIEKRYKDKASYIRLEVVEENIGAIQLYERKGYEVLKYKQMLKKL